MTDVDTANLRRLAEAATPGPWFAWDRGVGWLIALDPDANMLLPEGFRTDLGRAEDATYIAAVSPDVLVALLDRLERAEAAARTAELAIPHLQRGAVSEFVQWVATQAAYNGAGDPGQQFYDECLNPWLDQQADRWASEREDRP